ncbi:hypothetical protein [Hyphomonas sp.]|uniref:hypothetical protein n=1 Tax=Hyphomonas sp. TaxID=87 RepID=UPI000C978F5C|nr:hypothetical protein [Hyphomonas sp.]MAL44574.1 hypothetical protein [Hyphomonas sp.]|tara:strand:+ start:35 stop:445 length:411 start_codon:yes stop_codon:yes gene_type:complete
MLPFLGFLSNPITKLVADKVIGAASHAMEKKKIIRAAEIEATKELDIVKLETAKLVSKAEAEVKSAQVKAGENSLKDEWLTLVFTGILIAHFVPYTQPHILKGWELLNNAPDMFWVIILTIVGGSFGVNTLNKWKK